MTVISDKSITIMIKVIQINKVEPYKVECRFNNGISKKLDVYPLIQNHKDLAGIEQLLEVHVLKNVRIGQAKPVDALLGVAHDENRRRLASPGIARQPGVQGLPL